MSDLIVIAYDDEQKGYEALKELSRLERVELIKLEDAAVVVKNQQGKVKVKQTLENEHTGSAALWGGFWGLLIGLLFLSPLLWGLVGALLGGILGKTTDLGIDNKFIKDVGNSLEPGHSAIFMLVFRATADKVLEEMKKLGGTVYQTSLSSEDEEKLKKALANEDIKAVAHDSMELEETQGG